MPLPPSAPPDLRIFARAICPQITAGIAVNSQPHVNERTAKMRLQIATAGVRGTVCGIAVGEGGGVSFAMVECHRQHAVSVRSPERTLATAIDSFAPFTPVRLSGVREQ